MCNLDKIVDRCKKGDRKAGEQLYHMFSAKMFAICIQYSKSREEAEDNLQSDVVFLTTANDLSTVPRPLLDRMEVIELPSYTAEEKRLIARRHLLSKQMKKHGLSENQLIVDDETLDAIISGYTREAGVRRLEQVLAKLCRNFL